MNDQEDDQILRMFNNTTTGFAQGGIGGSSTPPLSDIGSITRSLQSQMGLNISSKTLIGLQGQTTSDNSDSSLMLSSVLLTNFNFLDEYKPENPEIDIEQLRKSQNFNKKRYVDALFFGQIINQKRHGTGVMKYKSGRLYEGEWENDVRHGSGYEKYVNGNTYCGQFENGKAHGPGKYLWKVTDESYDGEWFRGYRHGYGIWKNKIGDTYIGQWNYGRAMGYGVFTWKSGDKYEGEWSLCLKDGRGFDTFENGDSYRGQYKKGKPEGEGTYTWSNGSYYSGIFINGLKHGKGHWKKGQDKQETNNNEQEQNQQQQQTNEYIGEYQLDKKNGFGEFKWQSGNIYKGNYKNDERDGHGEMVWKDGSKYLGQWKRGIQHGYGKMIFTDGTIKEGYFDNNVFVGEIPPANLIQEFNIRDSSQGHRQLKNQSIFNKRAPNQRGTLSQNQAASIMVSRINQKKSNQKQSQDFTTNKDQDKLQRILSEKKLGLNQFSSPQPKTQMNLTSRAGRGQQIFSEEKRFNNNNNSNKGLKVNFTGQAKLQNYISNNGFLNLDQDSKTSSNQTSPLKSNYTNNNIMTINEANLKQKIDQKYELQQVNLNKNNNNYFKTLNKNKSQGILSVSSKQLIQKGAYFENYDKIQNEVISESPERYLFTNKNLNEVKSSDKESNKTKKVSKIKKQKKILAKSRKVVDAIPFIKNIPNSLVTYSSVYAARLFETNYFQSSNYNQGLS